MARGMTMPVPVNAVTTPAGVIRPMEPSRYPGEVPRLVNHRFPSGPAVIASGEVSVALV